MYYIAGGGFMGFLIGVAFIAVYFKRLEGREYGLLKTASIVLVGGCISLVVCTFCIPFSSAITVYYEFMCGIVIAFGISLLLLFTYFIVEE